MIGLRFSSAARARLGLSLAELPEDMAAIRHVVAAVYQHGQDGSLDAQDDGGLEPINAGQLQAASLVNAALAAVVDRYRERLDSNVFEGALQSLEASLGKAVVDEVLAAYAEGYDASSADRPATLEAVALTWLANVNPAMTPLRSLVDDEPLRTAGNYDRLMTALAAYFRERPPFGPDDQPLLAMLRSPAIAVPDSLRGQLAYIRERWAELVGEELFGRLLLGMDVLAEDERTVWLRMHPMADPAAGAAASSSVYSFRSLENQPEGFTPDHDWHPRVVLIAKNAHVWLDQLSRRYACDCHRLDLIPDAELDRLASWGVTGLWLIGIWQRSRASEDIKRRRGNPDAAASAYALDDYRVADDLGGEEAWANLRDRCSARGLRLASDMVPNHMGVDSHWVMDHPEWFLSLSAPPYPSYSFNGPDLSNDDRVGIFVEDHYWDATDAAVVFKRLDRASGDTRYIYHGNDGTSFPWNDTAQLDYIRAEVREQVIQTILQVARRFPIIRFDAAMVLAKEHIKRLWWPEPGTGGGAIPSRAEHAMRQAEFDRLMPIEFWREVVDRVRAEGLDTLLLAEAFWLLEGYFVRTLGMHRVYNSAFMHMLRDERNAEYRLVMKNTLEFDPEVLKRYVNFMSNPDEKPAIEQFGSGDKYFGVCTLLATLPGLPMVGHGQIEGFAEKYGMEYRRAYRDEPIDEWLVTRHEREIFPLLKRRAQFAEARDFRLYDFATDNGVNDDVYAYSNGQGSDRSLVVYNNRFAATAGRIHDSVAFSQPDGSGGRKLVRRTLGQALGLPGDEGDLFATFRDQMSGLEYVRAASELNNQGLWLALDGYGRYVFLDFRQVRDSALGQWRRLTDHLGGRGVPSLAAAMDELVLEPVRAPFGRMVNVGTVRRILEPPSAAELEQLIAGTLQNMRALLGAADHVDHTAPLAVDDFIDHLERDLQALSQLRPAPAPHVLAGTLALLVLEGLGASARSRLDSWGYGPVLASTFRDLGADEALAWRRLEAVRALAGTPRWAGLSHREVLAAWLEDDSIRRAMGVNQHNGVLWLRAEPYDELVDLALTLETVHILALADTPTPAPTAALAHANTLASDLRQAAIKAGYRVDKLVPPEPEPIGTKITEPARVPKHEASPSRANKPRDRA